MGDVDTDGVTDGLGEIDCVAVKLGDVVRVVEGVTDTVGVLDGVIELEVDGMSNSQTIQLLPIAAPSLSFRLPEE